MPHAMSSTVRCLKHFSLCSVCWAGPQESSAQHNVQHGAGGGSLQGTGSRSALGPAPIPVLGRRRDHGHRRGCALPRHCRHNAAGTALGLFAVRNTATRSIKSPNFPSRRCFGGWLPSPSSLAGRWLGSCLPRCPVPSSPQGLLLPPVGSEAQQPQSRQI